MDGMLSSRRDSPSFTRATGKTPVRSSVRFPGVILIMTDYPQFTVYFNSVRISEARIFRRKDLLPVLVVSPTY